ncbi:hypothetical protein JCM11491_000352 [Sporobolomyces phaffii]
MSTFAAIQTSQAPAYSTRAYAYHSARLYASCGASSHLAPPASSQMAPSASPSSASTPRFPDLSLLRSNLPAIVPTSPSAFPVLTVGTPSRETPPGTPSFFPSFLSSSHRGASCLSSSPSTYVLHPTLETSPRSVRPPLRSGAQYSSYPLSHPSSSSSSSSASSYSGYSTVTASTALSTPTVFDKLGRPHPYATSDLAVNDDDDDDDEEEKRFRLSVRMHAGEFDGDMEEERDDWFPDGEYDDVGMDGTESMEMD